MVDSHYSLICLVFSAVDVLWGLIASDSILSKDRLFSVSTAYHILASIVAFNFAFFIFYFNKDNETVPFEEKERELVLARLTSARDLQSVIDEADHALYYVKENGRDGIKILKERN